MPEEWTKLDWWISFLRNTVMLGAAVGGILWWGLGIALDDRYAKKSVADENAKVIQEVKTAVAQVQQDVTGLKAWIARDRLFELQSKQCEARSAETRRWYAREIQESQTEYRRITGQDPPSPPGCNNLQ